MAVVRMFVLAHPCGRRCRHCRAAGRALISLRGSRVLRGFRLPPWLLVTGVPRTGISAIMRMEMPVAARRRVAIAH